MKYLEAKRAAEAEAAAAENKMQPGARSDQDGGKVKRTGRTVTPPQAANPETAATKDVTDLLPKGLTEHK